MPLIRSKALMFATLLSTVSLAAPTTAAFQGNNQDSEKPSDTTDSQAESDGLTPEELEALFPAGVDLIRKLKKATREQHRAQRSPVTAPRLIRDTQLLPLGSGSSIPIIDVSDRYETNLTFLDSTGKPWPVEHASTAVADEFDIAVGDGEAGNNHNVRITPKQLYGGGNLTIKFEGLSSPVPFVMNFSDTSVVLAREYRMQARGPQAGFVPTGVPLVVERTDANLTGFLDMVPPTGARMLRASGAFQGLISAWTLNGEMYVRTPLSLLSPGIAEFAQGSGAPGFEPKVYKLISPASVLLVSYEGEPQFVQLES